MLGCRPVSWSAAFYTQWRLALYLLDGLIPPRRSLPSGSMQAAAQETVQAFPADPWLMGA